MTVILEINKWRRLCNITKECFIRVGVGISLPEFVDLNVVAGEGAVDNKKFTYVRFIRTGRKNGEYELWSYQP